MFKKKFGLIALILCIVLTMGYFAVNTGAVSTVLLAIQGAITDGNLVKFSGTNGIGVDAGLSATNVVKCKFDATSAPTVNNDVDEGYTVGSRWLDITNLKSYVCLDNTDGAAVWIENVVEGDMNKSTYDADEDGDIDVAAGGTEKSSWTLYAIPYLSGTTAFGEIPIGTAGQVLKVSAGATGYEFADESGGVDTSGTPEANDIARFTDVDTIEGINYTELKTALALSSDDLSDVASIAMLDENEIVTACWYFYDNVYQEYESDLSTYFPFWGFVRRRDGDPTYIVTTGDILGAVNFSGARTEDPLSGLGAVIRGVAEGTFGSNDYPTKLEFFTVPDDSGTLALRMAIDNAGNIKMGDGAWTNYVNISNLGVLTLEGTANIEGVDATELSYLDGVTSDIQTQIDAKKGKNYYSALGSDHTYSDNADTDSQPVGEAVAFGDLLYPDWTAGEWLKADADLAAKMPGLRIALESKTDSQTCLMLVKGYIRDDDAFEFTASMVHASVTPGAMSSTAPTETGDQVQRVGVAKSADILFFDPSIDVGEI